MRYDNYIFDFYGTLVDIHTNEDKPYLWRKMAAILTDLGFPYNAKELKKDYIRFVEEEKANVRARNDLTDIDIELRKVFRKLLSPWASDELVDYVAVTFRVISRDYITLYEDVPDIFDMIHSKGGKVFLLSNAQTCFTVPEIKTVGIYDMFDDIFISSDYEMSKPTPEFMKALVSKHKLDISRSIMIGNDYTSDIKIAQSTGMDSLYLQTNTSPKPLSVDKIGATYADMTSGEPTLSKFIEIMG